MDHGKPPTLIRPQLYLGDRNHAGAAAHLKSNGITHVLCCINGRESNSSLAHCRVPMSDYGNTSLAEVIFPVAFEFLSGALQDPLHKTLVHCTLGINRSATIVVGWLMYRERLSLRNAHALVVSKRGICIHDGYMQQLRAYDVHLFGRHSTNDGELPTTSSAMAQLRSEMNAEHAPTPGILGD